MNLMEYEKILTSSKKVDWYGTQVPEKLITRSVRDMASMILEGIDKFESENESSKSDSKKNYIEALWGNVRALPYKLNGDPYQIYKKEIESKVVKTTKTTSPEIKKPESVKVRSIKKK